MYVDLSIVDWLTCRVALGTKATRCWVFLACLTSFLVAVVHIGSRLALPVEPSPYIAHQLEMEVVFVQIRTKLPLAVGPQ